MSISQVGDYLQNSDATVRLSVKNGGWQIKPKGELSINVSVTKGEDANSAITGIYGDPVGLLQLAEIITAIANIDQSAIPDRNCPPDEGIHVTLNAGQELQSDQVTLFVGRLDRKSDGKTPTLDPYEQVMIFKDSDKF